MREIKFRGNRVGNGKWVYGVPLYSVVGAKVIIDTIQSYEDLRFYTVIPETVGQFTGLHDKNGKEIYEGNILRVETGWYKSSKDNPNDKFDNGVKGVTYWTIEYKIHLCKVGYMAYGIDRRFNRVLTPSMILNNKAEVVGDVCTNPELLKEVSHETQLL